MPLSPEKREAARLRSAAWRAALAQDPKALAAYRARHAEQQRKRRFRNKPKPLVGSVLLAGAAPSHGRDVLRAVTDAAGRFDDRDELIAEAVLLVLEGAEVREALALAKRKILRDQRDMRHGVPIHFCEWL